MKYLNYKVEETETKVILHRIITDEILVDNKKENEYFYYEDNEENFDWDADLIYAIQYDTQNWFKKIDKQAKQEKTEPKKLFERWLGFCDKDSRVVDEEDKKKNIELFKTLNFEPFNKD